MLTLKLVLAAVLLSCLLYAIARIFPRKLRLVRRLGPDSTNADLIAAAKSGDREAMDLYKQSRRLLWISLPTGILLSVLHTATKKRER